MSSQTLCIIPYWNSNDTQIEIIKFGSNVKRAPFIHSFGVVNIEFNTNFQQILKHSQMSKNEIDEKFGFNLSINKQFRKAMGYYGFCGFECEYIQTKKSRYLLFIGGKIHREIDFWRCVPEYSMCNNHRFADPSSIIIFNFETREWIVKDVAIPNERNTLLYHCTRQIKCIRSQETEAICIMERFPGAFCNHLKDCNKTSNLKLVLYMPMVWNLERLLWIAYYKNDCNKKCFLRLMSKDIIIYILRMCKWSLFDLDN